MYYTCLSKLVRNVLKRQKLGGRRHFEGFNLPKKLFPLPLPPPSKWLFYIIPFLGIDSTMMWNWKVRRSLKILKWYNWKAMYLELIIDIVLLGVIEGHMRASISFVATWGELGRAWHMHWCKYVFVCFFITTQKVISKDKSFPQE